MERDSEQNVTRLKGQVQVIFNQQILNCDEAEIYWKKDLIVAWGNLNIQTPTTYVQGEKVELNYKTNKGKIYKGYIRSGQVVFEGDIIEKIGDKEYIADGAYYTACTTCPPAWSFSGSEIQAEIGGYAYIKNSIFRVADFPVFWLPYLVVPLKSKRQTGFLVPSLDFSDKDGEAFTIPFFWAIDRSQDATFKARYYAKRGQMFLTNYRYLLSKESGGNLNFAALRDQIFKNEERLTKEVSNNEFRWFSTYAHYFDLPNGYVNRMQLNLASDLLYPTDFPIDFPLVGEPAMVNRTSITKNFEFLHLSADINYNVNLLKSDPLAKNNDAVHRFPEFNFQIKETPILGDLQFSFDGQYVHFARNDLAYDDVILATDDPNDFCDEDKVSQCVVPRDQRDGSFDPNRDIVRAGERMDLNPALSYPMVVGKYFTLLPRVRYRYTQYAFTLEPDTNQSFDTNPVRQYLQTQIGARTSLSKIYEGFAADSKNKYRHEIVASIDGSTIPYFDQTSSTFFGDSSNFPANKINEPISDADFGGLRGIQFDDVDRITDRQLVTVTVDNLLTRKKQKANGADYRRLALVRLAQSYDFNEAKRETGAQPWSAISGLVDLRLDRFNTNTQVNYFPYLNKTNTSTRFQLLDKVGNYLEISYSQIFTIPEDPKDFNLDDRTENIGAGARLRYSFINLTGQVNYSFKSSQINSWAIYTDFIPPGNCWGVKLEITRAVNSDPRWKFSFDYKFGGT